MKDMKKEWWKSFFGKEYVESQAAGGQFKHTKQEVNFLEKAIPLVKKNRILDLCCGHGRHTIELAKRGHKVWGLDYSQYELRLAKAAANQASLDIDFRHGDARSFRYSFKFDVILNMFTAFGYGSREDDEKIIRRVGQNLKKGGKFFVDLLSLPWLWRNYKPQERKKLSSYTVIMSRTFDFFENVNVEVRKIKYGNQTKTHVTKVRFYTLPELHHLFAQEGLKFVKVWGSFKGEPYGLDSKRMIVLAKKS